MCTYIYICVCVCVYVYVYVHVLLLQCLHLHRCIPTPKAPEPKAVSKANSQQLCTCYMCGHDLRVFLLDL